MMATIMLAALVASLAFVLAAYCAERGLRALGRPTRSAWILASAASIAVPAVQLVALSFWSPDINVEPSWAQTLALTTILTVGVVERVDAATAATVDKALIAAWLSASLVLLVRFVLASRSLERIARRWTRAEVAGVTAWISDSCGPAVVGLRRPEIVIPRRIAELPLEEQRLAVTHELAHIAAKDQWVVRAAALALVLLPWNVFLWIAARRLRGAIETDCDARVLRNTPNVHAYASLILNVASWPRESPAGALALGEGAVTQLERRLQLMTSKPGSRRLAPGILAFASALTLAVYGCEVAVNTELPERQRVTSHNEGLKLPSVITTATKNADAFFEFQVDKPVTTAPGSGAPRYPQILRSAGVEGEVLAQFVVDVDGRADAATFKALKASHDLFAEAVHDALPSMRFVPAEVAGKRVKQVVQQPFAFRVAR